MKPWLMRHLVLPSILSLRGEPVAAAMEDLRRSAAASPEETYDQQIARFRAVAKAAQSGFAFYREMLSEAGVDPDTVSTREDLAAWPLTDRGHLARELADLQAVGTRLPAHTVRMSGGSSGEPSIVLADRQASGYALAARDLCQGWYGIRPGDRQIRLWGRRVPRFAARERLKDVLLNRLRLDSLTLAPDRREATLARILRFGAEYVYGYASLLRMFFDAMDDDEVAALRAAGLKAVVSTSEVLPEAQRAALEERLGVPVADEYGCSEVEILAYRCPRGNRHVVAGNLLVEIVRLGDEPEGYGRVVVTDLHNKLMPVVRYRLEDVVSLDAPTCDCGCRWPCLGPVLGRAQGQFIELAGGRKVHSQFVVYLMEEMVRGGLSCARFQIVQEGDAALAMRLEPRDGAAVDPVAVAEQLRRETSEALGPDVTWRVDLEEPGSIPRTAGGKHRHFVDGRGAGPREEGS